MYMYIFADAYTRCRMDVRYKVSWDISSCDIQKKHIAEGNQIRWRDTCRCDPPFESCEVFVQPWLPCAPPSCSSRCQPRPPAGREHGAPEQQQAHADSRAWTLCQSGWQPLASPAAAAAAEPRCHRSRYCANRAP